MRISDHPRLAISALVGVFFLAFALSIYSSGAAATSTGTNQAGSDGGGVAVTLSSSGGSHVVHISYYVYSSGNLDNVSAVYYTTSSACAHNN
jgi:hypothetical protein